METEKAVLLARPHPFIQEAMSKILLEAGFAPAVVQSLDDLRHSDGEGFVGAVISTSVLSTTKEHYLDVFKTLRKNFPGTPILFATLVPLEQMASMLQKSLKTIEPMSRVVTLENAKGNWGSCQPMTYVLVHKNQLEDALLKDKVSGLIRQHFGDLGRVSWGSL